MKMFPLTSARSSRHLSAAQWIFTHFELTLNCQNYKAGNENNCLHKTCGIIYMFLLLIYHLPGHINWFGLPPPTRGLHEICLSPLDWIRITHWISHWIYLVFIQSVIFEWVNQMEYYLLSSAVAYQSCFYCEKLNYQYPLPCHSA